MSIHSFILYSIFALINPHLSILFHLKGYSSSNIGILMSAFFITGLVGPILTTSLLNRMHNNSKIFFLVFPLFAALIMFLIGISTVWILVLILMLGFGFIISSLVPLSDATLIHILHNPHKEYGITRAAGTMGFIVVGLAVLLFPIIDLNIASTIYWPIILLLLLFSSLSILIPNNTFDKELSQKHNFSHNSLLQVILSFPPSYFVLLIMLCFNHIGLSSIVVYLALYARVVYGVSNVTIIWTIAASSEIIGLIWGQRIVSRLGYVKSAMGVLFGTMIRLLLLGGIHHSMIIYLSQLLHIFSFALGLSIMMHYVNNNIEHHYKTIAIGVQQTVMAIARTLTAMIGGILINIVGFTKMFSYVGVGVGIGSCIVLLMFILLDRKLKNSII